MSSEDDDYEATSEINKIEDTPQKEKDNVQLNEDRASEIVNVEYVTVSDWITKEMKRLKADCLKMIDKTEFEVDPDEDDD